MSYHIRCASGPLWTRMSFGFAMGPETALSMVLTAAGPVAAPTRVSPTETLRCVAAASATTKKMKSSGLGRLAEAVKAFASEAPGGPSCEIIALEASCRRPIGCLLAAVECAGPVVVGSAREAGTISRAAKLLAAGIERRLRAVISLLDWAGVATPRSVPGKSLRLPS